jgi:hypothetical protein
MSGELDIVDVLFKYLGNARAFCFLVQHQRLESGEVDVGGNHDCPPNQLFTLLEKPSHSLTMRMIVQTMDNAAAMAGSHPTNVANAVVSAAASPAFLME